MNCVSARRVRAMQKRCDKNGGGQTANQINPERNNQTVNNHSDDDSDNQILLAFIILATVTNYAQTFNSVTANAALNHAKDVSFQ